MSSGDGKPEAAGKAGPKKAASAQNKQKKAPAKKATKAKGKKKQPKGLTVITENKSVPAWITACRLVLVLALAASIPTVVGVEHGRRLFWAASIASLPAFWVVGGYHLWRRLCPLAVLAQLGRILGVPGSRRVNAKSWLARNYMLLQMAIMIVCLSLRLIMTNGTPWALAGFLIGATIVAIVLGFFYTGKTWCNYVCPVGMVEKFYTEPARLSGPANSQCSPCTACKKNCPDIDLEQGYWKELDQPARRIAYFSWPGIVLAFYTYFYFVAGNWDYYFSGAWTLENGQIHTWLSPGFFFFEPIPVVLAAPLTLIVFGLISFLFFALIEKLGLTRSLKNADDDDKALHAKRIRHRMLALTGLVGFITFYFFGGQPTIRLAPGWFGNLFSTAVVIAASAIFFKRWARTEDAFVKERFAQKLLKKWEWGDEPASNQLSDIYLLHHERTAQRDTRLSAYKETVREMVADGLVTRGELVILDSLRAQLGVSDKEHQKILAELSDEERQLFDPDYQGSVEQRLQQEQYERDLQAVIVAAARAGQAPAASDLETIRLEHAIELEEHKRILGRLLDDEGPVIALFREEITEIETVIVAYEAAAKALEKEPDSSSYQFIAFVCSWRARQRLAKAISSLAPVASAELSGVDLERLLRGDETHAKALRGALKAQLADEILAVSNRLLSSPDTSPDKGEAFMAIASDSSRYLRAASAHVLSRRDDDKARDTVRAATDDEHPLVREAAYNALGIRGRLKRELMAKALKDQDPRVRQAAVNALSRASGNHQVMDTQAALDEAGQSSTQGVYATLNAEARMESLTTLEKMMFLRHVPMFESLEPDDLEEATLLAQERRFPAGTHLCVEGEPGDDIFIIVSGTVEAWVGGDQKKVLGRSGPGSCIGEMAVFDDAPRSATVTSIDSARTLVLPGEEFKQLMMNRPAIGQSIISVLVGRMRAMISAPS